MLEKITDLLNRLNSYTDRKIGLHEFIKDYLIPLNDTITKKYIYKEYFSLNINGNVLIEVDNSDLFNLNSNILSDKEFCQYIISKFDNTDLHKQYSVDIFKNILSDDSNFDEKGLYIDDVWTWYNTEVYTFSDNSVLEREFVGYEFEYIDTYLKDNEGNEVDIYCRKLYLCIVWESLNFCNDYQNYSDIIAKLSRDYMVNFADFENTYEIELENAVDDIGDVLRVFYIPTYECIAVLGIEDNLYHPFDNDEGLSILIHNNNAYIQYFVDDILALMLIQELYEGGLYLVMPSDTKQKGVG